MMESKPGYFGMNREPVYLIARKPVTLLRWGARAGDPDSVVRLKKGAVLIHQSQVALGHVALIKDSDAAPVFLDRKAMEAFDQRNVPRPFSADKKKAAANGADGEQKPEAEADQDTSVGISAAPGGDELRPWRHKRARTRTRSGERARDAYRPASREFPPFPDRQRFDYFLNKEGISTEMPKPRPRPKDDEDDGEDGGGGRGSALGRRRVRRFRR